MAEPRSTDEPTPRSTDALRVLAVDDEPPALGELVYLLERTPGIAAVLPAGSAADALALLQAGGIDAVFLDIRMPGIDGLALAGILGRFAAPPPVVFVTAFDSHAVQAFDVAAVDYLLKPIRAERLAEAVERVQRRLDTLRAEAAAEREATEPEAPAAPAPPPDETIAVELGGVTRYVRRSDVVYVEAQRDYVRLCTRTSGHLVRIPLAALEERWAPVGFLRVHRRYLVNSAYVEGLRSSAGMVSVDLGQDQHVPVSRRFTSAVRAALVQRHRLDREPGRSSRRAEADAGTSGPEADAATPGAPAEPGAPPAPPPDDQPPEDPTAPERAGA
ncbi:MAG: LytTR family DNA-binding domain-containing protein [Candidatus Nanopelagicales bacterium]|jgi:DNA-binding LytR/AlgR family response regulator|nr:LytTR family DNA-binding domain-containing protein [Candidatus Nanopelagicales bacterium]